MSMTLPNLDDVSWEQLNEEARSLIPAYAPDWTNFNPSDPGITLLELLAHFSEMLLYRANRIGDEQIVHFLRLINGPAWRPRKPLDEERRATLLALEKPARAVTAADFEALAIAGTKPSNAANLDRSRAGRIARAKCVSDRNLEYTRDDALYNAPAPGHMSVVVVPRHGVTLTKQILRAAKQVLETAKLITTRVHVVPPVFVTFGIRLTLVKQRQASAEWINDAAMNRLLDFFDPLRGGHDEKGWPFGRNIYVSELYQLMGQIPGVDFVARTRDAVSGEEMDELAVDPAEENRLQYNDAGELESIEVHEEELVTLKMAPEDIVIKGNEGHS
jgi:Baseplate J-like protein